MQGANPNPPPAHRKPTKVVRMRIGAALLSADPSGLSPTAELARKEKSLEESLTMRWYVGDKKNKWVGAMKTILKAMLVAGAALAVTTGAHAATVIYNFGIIADTAPKTTGDLGQTATYTVSGLSVTASAFGLAGNGTADHLYGKGNGGDENGLGMTNDPSGDHEIYFREGFVQLDLGALVGKVIANQIFAAFNSTTSGETWTIYGTNTAGAVGSAILPSTKTVIATGGSESVNTLLTGGFQYYDFVSSTGAGGANGGNVLLKSLTVTPRGVPEPETWALMTAGFGGMGAMLRRRRGQAAGA
jgi:hypothetical protein